MDKEKMKTAACLMLVDMAGDGVDIQGFSIELRYAYAFGSDDQFLRVCEEISEACKKG